MVPRMNPGLSLADHRREKVLIRQLALRDVIPDSDDSDANCIHLWHQYASICINMHQSIKCQSSSYESR